jgi:hypothetical protein
MALNNCRYVSSVKKSFKSDLSGPNRSGVPERRKERRFSMHRNMLWGILILYFFVIGHSSCSQVSAINSPQPILISENGIQSIGMPEILSAINKAKNNDEIKGILKDRVEILLHHINRMNTKWADIDERVDEHLYVSGIRTGIGFTDLFFIASDSQSNDYRVIVRKENQKILLSIIG